MAIIVSIRLRLRAQIKQIYVNPLTGFLLLKILFYDTVHRLIRNSKKRRSEARSSIRDFRFQDLREMRSQRGGMRYIEMKRMLNGKTVLIRIKRSNDMEMVGRERGREER